MATKPASKQLKFKAEQINAGINFEGGGVVLTPIEGQGVSGSANLVFHDQSLLPHFQEGVEYVLEIPVSAQASE